MQTELESLQKLLLWLLAVQDDGSMFLNEMKLSLKPASKRKELHRAGLTEEFKAKNPATGRSATKIQLTDKGWEWCQDHLHEKIETTSRSTPAILSGILNALGRFFANQDDCNSLGELFALARPASTTNCSGVGGGEECSQAAPSTSSISAATISSDSNTQAANTQAANTQESNPQSTNPRQISSDLLEACQKLSRDQPNVRIRLKDLRPLVSQHPRTAVDAVLADLQQQGRLQLWRLDDPSEMTDLDREAAIKSEIGTEQHIIYLEGVPS